MVSQASANRSRAITQAPVGAQLRQLTIPMVIAVLAIMGLGVADSYFVSFLGTRELAAIGFTTPVTSIIVSVALGLGMGISVMTSRLIGAQDTEHAAKLVTHGFVLTLIVATITVTALAASQQWIFSALGAREQTLKLIHLYMSIWLLGAPFLMLSTVSNSTFRALGDTQTAAKLSMLLTACNLVLDPILIFGLGPIPRLEIAGAALATALAVLITSVYSLYRLITVEHIIVFKTPIFAQFRTNIRSLLSVAAPAVLANALVPLIATALTTLVAAIGTGAVAGFGVALRLEAILLIIVYALSSTLPMFIGQNLGAQKPERIHAAIRLSFSFVFLWQGFLFLLFFVLSEPIARLFSDSPEVIATIVLFLSIVPASHGMAGNVILVNVAMNVLGKPRWALYINLARLLLLTVPLAWLGREVGGLTGLLWGVFIGNSVALLVAWRLLNRILTQLTIPRVTVSDLMPKKTSAEPAV